MNRRFTQIVIPGILLLLVSLGCALPRLPSLPFGKKATPTLSSTSPVLPKPGLPTPTSSSPLGAKAVCEGGGFNYREIPGFNKTLTSDTVVTLVAEGGNTDTGPVIVMGSLYRFETRTMQQVIDEMKKGNKDLIVSEPQPITVDGHAGIDANLEGMGEKTRFSGRLILVSVSPTHGFTMVGGAPPDQWNSKIKALFDAQLKSITFFEPKLKSSPSPTAKSTDTLPTRLPTTLPSLIPSPTRSSGGANPTQPGSGSPLFPKPKDAKVILETADTVVLTAKISLADAMTFYRDEAKKLGLSERTSLTVTAGGTASLVFDGAAGGKSLIVQIVGMPDGSVTVSMLYQKV